jgi:hypothetical protein
MLQGGKGRRTYMYLTIMTALRCGQKRDLEAAASCAPLHERDPLLPIWVLLLAGASYLTNWLGGLVLFTVCFCLRVAGGEICVQRIVTAWAHELMAEEKACMQSMCNSDTWAAHQGWPPADGHSQQLHHCVSISPSRIHTCTCAPSSSASTRVTWAVGACLPLHGPAVVWNNLVAHHHEATSGWGMSCTH